MKKFFISFLFFYFLLNFYGVSAVFAQGMEYLRTRSVPSEMTDSSQKESPKGYFFNEGDTARVSQVVEEPDLSQEKLPKDYFINAGDTIHVFVWQNPDLCQDIIVEPDGKISYPLVGMILAAGLTIDQLEKKITQGLTLYVKDPKVSLMVKEFASAQSKGIGHKITVLGEVNRPGIYTYTGTMNLIDAIAMAGYFNDKASENSVRIIRGNEIRKISLNLADALRKGNSKIDTINLKPNDIVFVPLKDVAHKIIILGEVNYPGTYTYAGKINLIEAISIAGYFNDKAREDSVMIIRHNTALKPIVIRVNLAEVLRKGNSKIDINLHPGDIVFVPKSFIADFNKFLANINPTLSTAQSVVSISRP